MAEAAGPSGPIAVYGATGYTGGLVARELRRRGAEMVLSGRSAAKLERLAAELGGEVATHEAALDDRTALRELLEPAAAVIACAGPFTLVGEPVLAAAVETGTHYVDTTGEQPFIRAVFEEHGAAAARAGCGLVPAMGFDYAPGDAIAALTAEGMPPLDEIRLAYAVEGFRPTRGTTLSALEMMRGDDVEWSDGALRPAVGGMSRGVREFAEPFGRRAMLRYPCGEQVTVPRHVETRNLRAAIDATMLAPGPLTPPAAALAAIVPLATAAMRTLGTRLRGPVSSLVARLPEGPTPDQRRRSSFRIECEAVAGSERRRGAVVGSDVYGLTAWLVAEAATRMAAAGFDRSGALAPSQAFGARELLEAAASAGIEYEAPIPASA